MDFQKVADAVEKSSQEIKDFLFSEEVGQSLQDLAQKYNLNEEISLQMVDEVGYVILGLKERSSLKSALANIGVEKTAMLSIIQEVSRKIFAELDKIEATQNVPETVTNKPETDSEEIVEVKVPEIPPVNLPMVEKGEVAHDVPQPARQDLAGSLNLQPTIRQEQSKPEIKSEPKVSMPDYRYEGGKDPYREPLG